jgi:O-antigen ligase
MAMALPTILVTYTRSMLLSPLLVIAAICAYVAVYRRDRLKRAIVLLAAFSVYGIIVIEALGLELAWLNRGAMLFEALKLQVLTLINSVAAKFGESHPLAATVWQPFAVAPNAMTSVPSSAHVVDDNVSTRIDEYRVAWKMFLDHPAIGNGLGAKHAMSFVRSLGDVLHQNVAYVHNWPLYTLMAAGLVGFVAYAFLLIRPVAYRYATPRLAGSTGVALRSGLSTLAIYALFFAVVRLITFNLLVAAAWGVFLAFRKTWTTNPKGHQAADASIARH